MKFAVSNKMAGMKPSAVREILKLTADPAFIPFSAGNPSTEAFPEEQIKAFTEEILTENPIAALQYSVSEGYPPLREVLRDFCDRRYHVVTDQDEVLIMSGAQQGIELTCKCLCNEGDVVVCEEPSFVGALNSFRSCGAKLAGVPMDEDGINIDKLEQVLKTTPNAKYLYTIPNFQNPSGITMSLEKRKAVLALAKKYDVVILEDNPYGDLRFTGEPVPAIKSLDTEGRVIYCGSFSKVLSPGLRVGYLVCHKDIASKIVIGKQCSDVHTAILNQMICHKFLTEMDYDQHIARLQGIYRERAQLMLRLCDEYFPQGVTHTVPEGGLFVWVTLPNDMDCMELVLAAKDRMVAVVPGNSFLCDDTRKCSSVRMNYSTPSKQRIEEGMKILGEVLHDIVK